MRRVLGNAGFRRLWFSQVGLALGDAVMQMGFLELFRTYGFNERVETAKLFFAVSLPGALLGPLAIAYLDRWQRRSVMMISDALRALVVLAVAMWLLPILTGRREAESLFLIYSMTFVIGAVTTFYFPARYALIPNLVENDQLIQANTLFTSSLAVANLGGRALGGFVAERIGIEWALLSNTLAYVVSVALIWRIQMRPHATTHAPHSGATRGGWDELKTGMSYLWRHPVALQLAMLAAVFAFLGGIFLIAFVGYAYETLGLGTGGLGYLGAAVGPGAAVGVVAMGRGGTWTKSSWLPLVQLIAAGILLVLLSGTGHPWVAAPLLAALGAVVATAMIPIDAKLQEQVDDQRRGAVFAARGMLTSATMIVAFWLQFGTSFFRNTPAPTLLLWLGAGTVVVAVLTFAALRRAAKKRA